VTQQLRLETNSANKIIYSNIPLQIIEESIENVVPQIGDKKRLIDLSLKNVLYLKAKKEISKEETKIRNIEVLKDLQRDLQLKALPRIIECFDNSNLGGTNPVASMVRFVDGKPDKKGYRHFNIKTVEGPDDFASMKEIVGRRYLRLTSESAELPNLIIVDGGKGQLSSAVEALQELNIYGQIPVIGIAKKLEEIYYPEDPLPLHINKKSQGLRLIQYVRDEAHRFAINFHRLKRSNNTIFTELESIPGIGKKTTDVLLSSFRSFKKIQSASLEELIEVVGKSKAEIVKAWQQKKES
jgi:excinuclease ABC subunit C